MNNLLKEVVAEAKAVRETALANAKIALEEAFAPKLQSMISHKIKEEMEEDEMMEMESEEEMEMNMEGEGGEPEAEMDMEMDMEDEEMPAEEEAPAEEEMPAEEEEMEMSDEELEEILRELDGEEDEMMEMDSEEEKMEGNYSEEDKMEGMKSESEEEEMMEMDSEEEEIDLEEIIKALREEESEDMDSMEEEESSKEEELEEAYEVIKYLRSKLNEVNLLNAKLLFVNKLFKKAELSESKKIKIIETFDRVRNVREAKLVYASLAENISSTPVKRSTNKKRNVSLTEGFASAPTKGTKKPIVESNAFNRFTELVNYNK